MRRIRIRAVAAVLAAALLVPAASAAQDGGAPPSVIDALRAAGFELPAPAERAARVRRDRRVQRLWSAALAGVGGAAGAWVGVSRNEWAFDEGWLGAGIAGAALGFGLYGLIEPLSWHGVDFEPQVVAARRQPGRGARAARGAGLALGW